MNEKQNIKQYFIKKNKTKIIIVSAFFILVCSIVISACSWTTGGEDIVFPEENISYMHHVKPFLALNCSYSPCHSDYNRAGGVALTEYWICLNMVELLYQEILMEADLFKLLKERCLILLHFIQAI